MTIKEKMDLILAIFADLDVHPTLLWRPYKRITRSMTAAALLAQLTYWYVKMDRVFYKTDKDIMSELELTKKELANAKKRLQDLELITVSHGDAEGKAKVCFYNVNLERLEELLMQSFELPQRGNSYSPKGGIAAVATPPKGVTITENTITENTTEKEYCAVSTALFTPDLPTEPEIATQDQPLAAAYESLRTSEEELNEFDDIWNLYAFKRNKPDAKKAYSKLSKKEKEDLRFGIGKYLEYLKHPDNRWRQKKQLGAFIRGEMWKDDWSLVAQAEVAESLGEHEEGYIAMKDWTLKNYPNIAQLEWLTLKEYLAIKNREPDFCGEFWRYHATERSLKDHIVAALKELNDNSFVRKNHTRVYPYLRDTIKKKLYA